MIVTEITEIAATVIVSLGGGGAIVFGLSNYLGRVWADRALEMQRQENARLNLDVGHQLALVTERAKNQFQMGADEHQVRFSKLHQKRAEVIAELYKQLVEVEKEGKRFVSSKSRGFSEEPVPAMTKLYDLYSFVDIHRIYLSKRSCELLGNFFAALNEPFSHTLAFGDIESTDPTFLAQKEKGFRKSFEAFQNEVPAARRDLEQEFRIVLGDEEQATTISAAKALPLS